MIARQARRWHSSIGLGVAAAVALVLAALVLYGLASVICGLISVNRAYAPANDGIDVYLRGNGVHVDLVLPLEADGVDWQSRLPTDSLGIVPGITENLAFGWGDRGFYLATPTWADLKISTAMWAVTGVGTTVMHVEAARAPSGRRSRHVKLSHEQYQRLVRFIEGSFRRDATGAAILVPGAHYGFHDAFFEGNGHYSAFKTCNEWTRQGLAVAGVRTPSWSPFEWALVYQLPD